MADFLDEKRKEIRARLQELKPLVDEYHRLEAAVQALEGVKSPTTAVAPRRSRSAVTRAGKSTGRRGRPRGSGTRAKEALELVRSNPGITIPELAGKMGIKQNYLYRVLPGLQKDGMVRKEGRGWHARDAA
jgi:sugar-specific transcriptional regulator TrmB